MFEDDLRSHFPFLAAILNKLNIELYIETRIWTKLFYVPWAYINQNQKSKYLGHKVHDYSKTCPIPSQLYKIECKMLTAWGVKVFLKRFVLSWTTLRWRPEGSSKKNLDNTWVGSFFVFPAFTTTLFLYISFNDSFSLPKIFVHNFTMPFSLSFCF